MASITIRISDETITSRLRIRAAEHGRSVEDEARDILRQAVAETAAPLNLGEAIRNRFAVLGGMDLDLPEREPMPEPPRFD